MESPPRESAPRPEFRDRTTGLAVFGVLSLVVAAFAVCFAALTPLSVFATRWAPAKGGSPMDPRSLVIAVLFYAGLAALFVTLGVGSLRARRWVRPVMLVVGWVWLACGLVALASWLVMLPTFPAAMRAARPEDPPIPEDMMKAVSLITSLFLLVVYVAVPGLFVWFYHDRDVQQTLEKADPAPRWTDRCPLPVLGMSLCLGAGAAGALMLLPYAAIPALGQVLTGMPAVLYCAAVAATLAVLARASYRLAPWGWWGTLAIVLIVQGGSLATFLRVDLLEIYERMNVSPEQIAVIRESRLLTGSAAILSTVLLGSASVAYLLFVRRYFRVSGSRSGK